MLCVGLAEGVCHSFYAVRKKHCSDTGGSSSHKPPHNLFITSRIEKYQKDYSKNNVINYCS
jgi:hypothetical protein